jgi:hypothetical protein
VWDSSVQALVGTSSCMHTATAQDVACWTPSLLCGYMVDRKLFSCRHASKWQLSKQASRPAGHCSKQAHQL